MTTLKVMTFNILSGGEDRLIRILEIVATQNPDILVLQECLGWDSGPQLASLAEALSLPMDEAHVRLAVARPRRTGNRYNIAVASRLPMRDFDVYNDPQFVGHCFARFQVSIGGRLLDIIGAHFDSADESLRLTEVHYLKAMLAEAHFAKEFHLFVGDLNSLCRFDPYPADLAVKMAATGRLAHGPPRFEVIDAILSDGWIDALRLRPMSERWVTAPRIYGDVHIDYRKDYIFVSPRLATQLVGADVVDAQGTSDHHPVVANFEFGEYIGA
jgi:exodeoxyribonuclease-3